LNSPRPYVPVDPYDSPDIHVDALPIETPARPSASLAQAFSSNFLLGFSSLGILLGPHHADLLSTDRRWRDGIETGNEQQ
jgi:hypothetical protein